MVKIFIIYGNREGEQYANYIDKHFKQNNLGSFLASPQSPDIQPGEKYQKKIDAELKNADIVIVVVTRGLKSSVAAMDEIQRVLKMAPPIPIIPYVKNSTTIPDELIKRQAVYFNKKTVNTAPKKKELELTMWRVLDRNKKETNVTSEQFRPKAQPFRPTRVVK